MTYHRHGSAMTQVVEEFNALVPDGQNKPVIVPMHIDLDEDPTAGFEPIRFGARGGAQVIVQYLELLREAGVAHVALNLRPSRRPVEDALAEVAESILPDFAPASLTSVL